MPEYYFDIETAPLPEYRNKKDANLDPSQSKIISMQYQRLDATTGRPLGELTMLREWEEGLSEKAIVEHFKTLYLDNGIWNFVPVGNNLLFEFRFMKHKLKQYFGLEGLKLGQMPFLDLKHTAVVINNGSFKGYGRVFGKSGLAEHMAEWYYDRNWPMIEQYIKQEAADFLKVYLILKKELPKISYS